MNCPIRSSERPRFGRTATLVASFPDQLHPHPEDLQPLLLTALKHVKSHHFVDEQVPWQPSSLSSLMMARWLSMLTASPQTFGSSLDFETSWYQLPSAVRSLLADQFEFRCDRKLPEGLCGGVIKKTICMASFSFALCSQSSMAGMGIPIHGQAGCDNDIIFTPPTSTYQSFCQNGDFIAIVLY